VKRKLLLANLALLAVTVAGAVHLRREWIDARAREQAVLRKHIQPTPPPPMIPLPATEPVRAASYSDIAQKMLFSKDRNPVVVVAPPPAPKPIPMPALPLFHGVLNLGDGAVAIMSEGPKGPHRDYQPGDKVGAFKLVAVDNEELVLEWEGQTIRKKVDEILDRGPAPPLAAGQPAAAASAAPPPPPVAKAAAAPGIDLGTGVKACVPGDTSPAGTVADGMRKVIRATPFGARCYWESEKSGHEKE
jgi:hypothetical protein